jgi:membrane fusion protein, heavy metal efflux system
MRKPLYVHRLFVFLGVIVTTTVLAACGGQEKELSKEQTLAVGLAATGAHTHEKPGETCFICDPSKRDKGRLWCNEHGRYEDRCWICHPDLEDKNRLYCKEHFLYEDECFICHPELRPGASSGLSPDKDLFVATLPATELFCNEHRVPETVCGICQPQLAATLQPGQSLLVRLPSMDSANKAGIRTGVPLQTETASGLQVLCEVQYNKNTLTKITPLVNGIVNRVFADVGDRVLTGDVLAELHSAEVAAAKSAYLSALVTFHIKLETKEREKRLVEESISAQKDYLEAEASFRMAQLEVHNTRQKLLNLGLSHETITEIERTEDTSARLKIRAPFKGTLIDRTAVTGQSVDSGDALFTLADLSTRWLILSMPSDRLFDIQVGQRVEAIFDEFPGETVQGKIVWIDTAIDIRTRLVYARALATSGTERMKAGLFGQAKIIYQKEHSGLLVPRDAVQYHEQQPFIFVKEEPDLYALRRVTLGAVSENRIEILDGLKLDDAVVTASSFLVMSEFLKSRLGAGCVDD